jgi:ubiquitin-protein ligase E3 C
MEMDNLRGRLLLSGTKLWNALYERWNRLANNAFCEESAWWFPRISSRENGAVAPSRGIHNAMGDDSGADDSDDDMSTEESGVQNELSAAEAESDALANSFRDPKMARILTSIPQALPFDRRVKLFHSLLKADKRKTMQAAASRRAMMALGGQEDDEMMWFDGSAREQIKVRRDKLYQDSMDQLNNMGSRLKHQVQVTFINTHGTEEAGIDGGGVFKEFVDDLIKDGFAAQTDSESKGGPPQLFSVTPEGLLSVNLDLSTDASMLSHYAFLGRVLSKAVYEGILVEPQFCLPFLNQLLGKVNTLEDLKNYDEEYYINLNKLRSFNDTEMESLGLTFELTVGASSSGFPPRTVELVLNGKTMPVTRNNVFQYTHAVANQLLNLQGARQTHAFLDGFREIIPVSWVRLFSAKELQKLISGDDSIRGIDVASLKRNMHYLGGYHESQPYIQVFWDILENDLSPEQQRKFLRFMTSCSRQPLLGFGSLEPMPSIQQIRLRPEELSRNSRLPTSQTCMNLLKLPNYQHRELLREKLLAAIEAGAGFELT